MRVYRTIDPLDFNSGFLPMTAEYQFSLSVSFEYFPKSKTASIDGTDTIKEIFRNFLFIRVIGKDCVILLWHFHDLSLIILH